MPMKHFKASPQICQLLDEVKAKHHPHLAQATIALEFVESKAYIKDEINFGKVAKFGSATKLWFPDHAKYDFLISLCADVWFGLLNNQQREALLDFRLSSCKVEYIPNTVVVNGKKQVIKDEFGRIEYTDQIKTDDEGKPVWKLANFGLAVVVENVKRYGIWYDGLLELKQAIDQLPAPAVENAENAEAVDE